MSAREMIKWVGRSGRNSQTGFGRDFARSERGNVAMLFAVSSVVIVGAAGAALDYSIYANAAMKAQSAGDSVALNAAIYVSKHGEPPQNNEELDKPGAIQAGTYTFEKLGIPFDNSLRDAKVTVAYGDESAVISVAGKTQTTLARVLGRETLDFESRSEVAYREKIVKDVASVVLILDSSGSMGFDDLPGNLKNEYKWDVEDDNKTSDTFSRDKKAFTPHEDAGRRMDGLRSAVNAFDMELDSVVGHQSVTDKRVLRVGLLAFNDKVLSKPYVLPDWKTLGEYTLDGGINPLDDMKAGGATNSAPPMESAETIMEGEDAIHYEANEQKPKKFVVLMTDGQNTQGVTQFYDHEGYYTRRVIRHYARGHESCFDGIVRDGKCGGKNPKHGYRKKETWSEPYDLTVQADSQPPNDRHKSWTSWRRITGDQYERFQVLSDWRKGRYADSNDTDTIDACKRMKDEDNVTIFSIGFALQEGYFESQDRSQSQSQWVLQTTDDMRSRAFSMLQECATSEDHFIPADDITSLNEAFRSVGQSIVAEVVRIKS